jgi:dihydropteroate synthase
MKEMHMHPVLEKPFAVLGVVNVTPDSFYDGGKHATAAGAADHARQLAAEGADILDIGGESTRPGAQPVSEDEECLRVLPVIAALARDCGLPISVDTTKAVVARRALDAGATWINDVSAGRLDPGMARLAAERACPVILMHSRKTPATMQSSPSYGDVVAEVKQELLERAGAFAAAGVLRHNIVLDPGIGFAKRLEDNLRLLRQLDVLVALGYPVCVGASRKSFVGTLTGHDKEERLWGSLAAVAAARHKGARLFRVHDVKETLDFIKVLDAINHA